MHKFTSFSLLLAADGKESPVVFPGPAGAFPMGAPE